MDMALDSVFDITKPDTLRNHEISSVHVCNPYDNSLIRSVVCDDFNSIEAAIVKAQNYDYSLNAWQRYSRLFKAGELLLAQRGSFAELIASESGKTIRDANVEVLRAHQALVISAEEAKRITGEIIPVDAVASSERANAMVLREPVGLIAAITPFNFPLNLVVHKLGPALAANNPVIVKPSEKTPLTAMRLRSLLLEAGFPSCMIQLLIGDPASVVSQLVSDERVKKVTFTGSVEIGKKITRQAGLKPVSMELGGNDPMIILADTNIEKLIPAAIDGAFGTNGERCTSVKRFIVEESVADEFAQRLVEGANKLVVGNQLDRKTDIGPLIDVNAARTVEQRIKASVRAGAKLLCGGKRDGAMLWPTVLDQVNMSNPVVADETFGPVAPIIRVRDVHHAIDVANDTHFGLQSGVFTDSLKSAKLAIEKIQAGAVMINRSPGFRAEHLPFGGVKSSGIGREGIRYAVDSMTTLKTVVM